VPPPGRSASASACEPYRELIDLALSRGRNTMAIWEELVDTCRFVGKLRGKQSPEACAVVDTAPDEEFLWIMASAHGARSAQRQVLPHAAVRPDSRL